MIECPSDTASFLSTFAIGGYYKVEVNATATDQNFLREYSEHRSESAFDHLVRRHVDLVYSAAKRLIRDPSLAEDVTQRVFLALADNAGKLALHPVLCAWLHSTTRNIAANLLREEMRRREREKEVARMQADRESTADASDNWATLEARLDDALCDLPEPDRELLFLRFFRRQTSREIANLLSISQDAAQKRISRALERLRGVFESRGVRLTAETLVAGLSLHAVEAAPAGLSTAIVTSLTSGAIHAAAPFAVTEALTMTALQKSATIVCIATALAAGVWTVVQTGGRQRQIQSMNQNLANLSAQISVAGAQQTDAASRLIARQSELQRIRDLASAVPRLQQEIEQIRSDSAQQPTNEITNPAVKAWFERVEALKQLPAAMPDKAIPELALLSDDDWIEVAKKSLDWEQPDTTGDIKWHLLSSQPVSLMTRGNRPLTADESARLQFMELRGKAKLKFGRTMVHALMSYAQANEGQIPPSVTDLTPYFASPPNDAMVARYEVRANGLLNEQPQDAIVLAERSFVDPLCDTRFVMHGSNAFRLQDMIELTPPAEQQPAQ